MAITCACIGTCQVFGSSANESAPVGFCYVLGYHGFSAESAVIEICDCDCVSTFFKAKQNQDRILRRIPTCSKNTIPTGSIHEQRDVAHHSGLKR